MATWGLEALLLKQESDPARAKDFVLVISKGHSKGNWQAMRLMLYLKREERNLLVFSKK